MKTSLGIVLALLGVAGIPAVSACSSGADESIEQSGTMTMNLVGTGASGTRYRLRTAEFVVNGPQNATLSTEADPDATSIRRELPAGEYIIRLRSGWTLERETDGVFGPIDAILISPNPVGFSIQDQGVTPVVFRFRAGEDVIDLGNGILDVTIDVEDGACPSGHVTCAGTCVDPTSDPANCGACGSACPAGVACVNGTCVSMCAAGHADCDGDGTCETDLNTSPQNCGACASACPPGVACVAGACVSSCAPGQTDCDGDGTCETDLLSDPANCGACANACAPGNACVNGTCVSSCAPGQADCDGDGTCETDLLSDPASCGACANACAPGNACVNGACSCPSPLVQCAGACRDVKTDPNNCGACGAVCPAGSLCESGDCVAPPCPAGQADCDGNPINGCETLLDSNPACGTTPGPIVQGDVLNSTFIIAGIGEDSLRIRVAEANVTTVDDLSVRLTLTPPPGVSYRLEAGCDGCVPMVGGQSVALGWNDASPLIPSDRDVFVNVVYLGGEACGSWALRVEGGVPGPITCSPR